MGRGQKFLKATLTSISFAHHALVISADARRRFLGHIEPYRAAGGFPTALSKESEPPENSIQVMSISPTCELSLYNGEEYEVYRIIHRSKDGKDTNKNLVIFHAGFGNFTQDKKF
ncbi:MAG: hypothetical protein BRC41_17505 [Cyanobacteria bacterium QH_9_48_43]|nr:MAG: hypothetical protein BRC35_16945 [Cyanobacteria bacterium QH_10_48_56]PSO80298.1 MAG: hypothetical protein BRC41_17505 [Cyanobacteria bacterium QH_9_48_43]PSP07991.1 MAG: hypothetical protein BRC54_02555 [Cyanobacteria bacterium SW_7_48_12]PSP10195.1 MAG: hypothetical protein BRC50_15590 [Cyanobacteria bacterium SW_11_48_12]PSP18184.1 MAG: hypothetical protein BRC52_12670 [Cyanobacteria bacterium SW_5_48_44]